MEIKFERIHFEDETNMSEFNDARNIAETISNMKPEELIKYTYRADSDTFLMDYGALIKHIRPDLSDEEINNMLKDVLTYLAC